MNANTLTLQLQGDLAEFIKKRAKKEGLSLNDAQGEAFLAIDLAIKTHDPARGPLKKWAQISVQNKLHRLAHGHDGDPLLFAEPVDDLAEDLAEAKEDEDDGRAQSLPPLSGVYGRIRALAVEGKDVQEIAQALRLTRRRVEQLLADTAAIRAAARLAAAQGNLFGGVA